MSVSVSYGGIALALSPSALVKVANAVKSDLLLHLKLLNVPEPPKNMSIPFVPTAPLSTSGHLTTSNGTFTPIAISFVSINPVTAGIYSVNAALSGKLCYADWHEDDTCIVHSDYRGIAPNVIKFSHDLDNFEVFFTSIALRFKVEVTLGGKSQLLFKVIDISIEIKSFDFSLPKGSILIHAQRSCIEDKIRLIFQHKISAMYDLLKEKLTACINDSFSTIARSGLLKDGILFSFQSSPDDLSFSDDGGIQCRVIGNVFCNGKSAPGEIGSVPLPDIPDDRDLIFNVNTYEFNSLFWAFYKQGQFKFTVSTYDIPEAHRSMFNTLNNKRGNRQANNEGQNTIDVSILERPTVTLQENAAYICYKVVLIYARAIGGLHTDSSEQDEEIVRLCISVEDLLEQFAMSTKLKNCLQCITFTVVPNRVQRFDAEIVFNTRYADNHGVSVEMFKSCWRQFLHLKVLKVLSEASKYGIPLPSVLQGVYKDYKIKICPGYVSAAVNIGSEIKFRRYLECHFGLTEAAAEQNEAIPITNFSF